MNNCKPTYACPSHVHCVRGLRILQRAKMGSQDQGSRLQGKPLKGFGFSSQGNKNPLQGLSGGLTGCNKCFENVQANNEMTSLLYGKSTAGRQSRDTVGNRLLEFSRGDTMLFGLQVVMAEMGWPHHTMRIWSFFNSGDERLADGLHGVDSPLSITCLRLSLEFMLISTGQEITRCRRAPKSCSPI